MRDKFFFFLDSVKFVVAIICWNEKHRDVLHGINFPLVTFCLTFRSFWLWVIVFVPMFCLNDLFLQKAMNGVALNTFLNVLLIFNICQCLSIIYPIFGKVGRYITKNGITFFHTALVLFTRENWSLSIYIAEVKIAIYFKNYSKSKDDYYHTLKL